MFYFGIKTVVRTCPDWLLVFHDGRRVSIEQFSYKTEAWLYGRRLWSLEA